MKGIILAGGTGSRLRPLTDVTNKHLLPVGPVPMIDHPIRTIKEAGITDIMVVTGTEHAGDVFSYCGSGERFGVNINFAVQDKPNGIAGALALCQTWASGSTVLVALGDNVFEHVNIPEERFNYENMNVDAYIFTKHVDNPERFGVCRYRDNELAEVIEKPEEAPSNWAVTGLYMFPGDVFEIIKCHCKPSGRGELEVTDIINAYLDDGRLKEQRICGYWSDAGTMESYRAANEWAWRQK